MKDKNYGMAIGIDRIEGTNVQIKSGVNDEDNETGNLQTSEDTASIESRLPRLATVDPFDPMNLASRWTMPRQLMRRCQTNLSSFENPTTRSTSGPRHEKVIIS